MDVFIHNKSLLYREVNYYKMNCESDLCRISPTVAPLLDNLVYMVAFVLQWHST